MLVLTLALIAAYFMSGQFAAYLAMSDLHERLDTISVENAAIASHIAGDNHLTRAELADVPELRNPDPTERRVVEIFEDSQAPISSLDASATSKPSSEIPGASISALRIASVHGDITTP